MRTVSLWLLAAGLAGCGNFTNEKSDDRPTYHGLKASIQTNRDLWAASAPKDYSYGLVRNCFCGMRPYNITVQGGQIFKVETKKFGPNGEETVLEVNPTEDPDVLSIEQLFAKAEAYADSQPDQLDVSFDPALHYPVEVSVNPKLGVTDDELTTKVEAFTTP